MARVFFVLLLLISTTVSAQVYKWVDKDGKVHITDTPPPDSVKGGKVKKIEPDKGIFFDKLYNDETIEAEKAKLEKSVRYYRGACKAKRYPPGSSRFGWVRVCEKNAERVQKSLDVLISNPDRYFYVMDQRKRISRGEKVDKLKHYIDWK